MSTSSEDRKGIVTAIELWMRHECGIDCAFHDRHNPIPGFRGDFAFIDKEGYNWSGNTWWNGDGILPVCVPKYDYDILTVRGKLSIVELRIVEPEREADNDFLGGAWLITLRKEADAGWLIVMAAATGLNTEVFETVRVETVEEVEADDKNNGDSKQKKRKRVGGSSI